MAKESAKNPKRKGAGRPVGSKKLPVDQKLLGQVEKLRGLGMVQDEIAHIVGVSPRTFYDMIHNSPELFAAMELGRARAKALVAQTAFQMATSGKNAPMTQFWLRTQAGWKEQVDVNVNGKTTVVFETQYGDGVLRQNAKEIAAAEAEIIENIVDGLIEEDECPSSESESE